MKMQHPALGLPCASPFGTKLLTWARIVNKLNPNAFPYEKVSSGSPGPRGKWPYIELDGYLLGCSILHLEKHMAILL